MFFRRWMLTVIALAVLLCAGRTDALAQKTTSSGGNTQPTPTPQKHDEIDILAHPTDGPDAPALRVPAVPEIKTPNYATAPIEQLQKTVRELRHLKAAPDQSQLVPLLNKMGAKTVEIAKKTPNLISHEAVVSEQLGSIRKHDYSFLVLQHLMGSDSAILDEYRIDLASGEKYQTEQIERAEEATARAQESDKLELPTQSATVPSSSGPPRSQGFVNSWVHFYPPNRYQSDFRYLGEQKMDGHQTHVVSFAQKPGSLRVPATIEYANKTYPMYLQGIAWVDASDYRIVRLRTDILFPPPGVPLRQFTAETSFEEVLLAEVSTALWLPRQVVVTSNVDGLVSKESHMYSAYRLFRAKSKLILNQ